MHNSTQPQPSLEELLENIRGWGYARNLIDGATPQNQFLKLVEEVAEIYEARSEESLKDGIGDSIVVLTIMAAQCGKNLEDIIKEPSYRVEANLEERIKDNIAEMYYAFSESMPEHMNDAVMNLIDLNSHMVALIELLGHMASKLARNKNEEVLTLIGQIALEVTMISDKSKLDFIECINMAWNDIKDRKGRMVDGIFIKDADY